MGLFPMHAWVPRVYANAPSPVSALIAATASKVAVYVLIRVLFFVYEPRIATEVIPVTTILAWAAAVGMVVGSVMAIAQTDLKRMLAYSSVAQVGYIVLGVGLANPDGFVGAVLHLVNHAFMKGCLFLVAGVIVYRDRRAANPRPPRSRPGHAADRRNVRPGRIRDDRHPADGRLLQ